MIGVQTCALPICFPVTITALEWLKIHYKLVCYIWNYNTSILEGKDSFGIKKINAELDISVDTNHLKNCIEFEQTYIQYSHLKEKYNIDIGDTL